MANFIPLNDRVLIKRVSSEEVTQGGIYIPDTAKEKPLEGEVVAIGSGKIMENGSVKPMLVKPGDRVLFAKYTETEIKLNGESFLLIREDDLLGIIL
ncbi:MAG: co-chaperone GroES [Deltaproteobacteria bacterium]|nr:MAG: co-chaperone GroES [Deltaproteobacteria bacterium]